jgi:site-specific DNA recombinase
MRAAIYARYSSENQRPESIEDQIASCRRLATARGYSVEDEHIYADVAASGAREDRAGLAALRRAASERVFDVALVDDLSRLARNTLLLLSVLEELRFHGVRVVSVADGLDSQDQKSTIGIQVRGIFNELQLTDLKKKTLRGQMGQKQRGFFVGEATFGYRSTPIGTIRMDKKGRPRPEGYRMLPDPAETAVVVRIFEAFAAGRSESAIVRMLNEEGVPGRIRSKRGWSPATVHRILRNEKYAGRWVWNRSETRRDPRTGRRRQFPKPESEWVVVTDESLRLVPPDLWQRVQIRLQEVRTSWPGGRGRRGFEGQQRSPVALYPTELLSGAMECGVCGSAIVKASGKGGGYYGCLGAAKGSCESRLLVRRTLAERVILEAVRQRIADTESLRYVFERVEAEVGKMLATAPESIRLKQAELDSVQRRIANFVDFVAQGRGSKALAEALVLAEQKADELTQELEALNRATRPEVRLPPLAWVTERVAMLQEVLERRTERSARLLRKLLGRIRLEPVKPDIGRPYFRAVSTLQPLALLEMDPSPGSEDGSNPLRWWRRRESNPRPKTSLRETLQV